jgi:hypothetical protein
VSPDSELTALSDEELRERLRAVRHEEADVSYERRLLHGKIDVLRSEVRQRMHQGAGQQGADSEALESLLGRLTDVLVHKGPPPIEAELAELGLDDEAAPTPQVPPADELPAFDTLGDDDLGALVRALVQREREVSARRRELHGTLDRLKGEQVARLQRRYAGQAGDE